MKHKSLKKYLYLLPMMLLMGLNACKHDDLQIDKANDNFRSGFDFVKNNYDLSLFAAAIEKSGISAQLNGAGPFTILAPSNLAFNIIGINRPGDFDKMNPDTLKFLVQRHILNERLLVRDIPFNGIDVRYRTLAGTELYTSIASRDASIQLYFNGSLASRKDVTLANGTLHVLDRVMKSTANTTVQSWLAKRPEYSILVSGLKKFGFWDELATEGPYTILAPKNAEFEAKGMTAEVIAGLNVDRYLGHRLFGCYVMRKKHFFISDFVVLGIINSDAFYYHQVPNDTYIMTLTAGRLNFSNINDQSIGYHVEVRTNKNYPYDIISEVNGHDQKAIDNLVDNGLVQDLQGILVLPEQALKNN
ncbi:fasciclin domain-containing protein [Pedobacter nyackensis]|uniref:Fasciclin domain-containing protein n=1 Tax=Pedobacter nyackensis TaxID=475255 RepID=A0A1W2CYI2_9SPHI|nr:fasciclin domain-containing protein [Pedobacter nyackensis]SMC89996.1 Fasciclin domain-containing protein [Pedobacter nyackensis]